MSYLHHSSYCSYGQRRIGQDANSTIAKSVDLSGSPLQSLKQRCIGFEAQHSILLAGQRTHNGTDIGRESAMTTFIL
jgi:hypothetical protein